jgi:hypothetical protein
VSGKKMERKESWRSGICLERLKRTKRMPGIICAVAGIQTGEVPNESVKHYSLG